VFLGPPRNSDDIDPFDLLVKGQYWPDHLDTCCGLNSEYRGYVDGNPPVSKPVFEAFELRLGGWRFVVIKEITFK